MQLTNSEEKALPINFFVHLECQDSHLVCANQIGVKNCKATNKPDGYEAIYYEKIREDILRYGFQNMLLSTDNMNPRKYKDIYAQDGCC